jgi:hypothetical protein
MKTGFVALISCVVAAGLAGCVSNPKSEAQQTLPHERFQRYGICYLKPVYITPPHGRVRSNVEGVKKIDRELADHMKLVFPNLTIIKDEAALGESSSPALVIEPVIEKMKFVPSRWTWRGGFRGSSFVQTRVNFRDLGTGKTMASPVFFRKASGAAGVFSWGATDHIMLSRVVWDVFDYVTKGAVPKDSIPPGVDAGTVDPSEETLARTVPVVLRPAISDTAVAGRNSVPDTVKGGDSPVRSSGFGKQVSQAELAEIALNEKDIQIRREAVAQITDQKFVAKVACEARDSGIRLTAVQALTDQVLLGNIAVKDRHWKVRLAAVERLTVPEVLNTVATRDSVEAVRDAARTRQGLLKR